MDGHVEFRRVVGFVSVCVVVMVWLIQGTWMEAFAGTVYSYTDERGNPVYTDNLQNVPEKYRKTVQQFERKAAPTSVSEKIKDFGSKLMSFRINMRGLSEDQTTVLNYAGGAAVFLLMVMYLSKESQMIRLLALGLLIILGIGTPVLLYTGEGGALNVMKNKANEAAQQQNNRLKQVSPH
jgi:hypothetical protein